MCLVFNDVAKCGGGDDGSGHRHRHRDEMIGVVLWGVVCCMKVKCCVM